MLTPSKLYATPLLSSSRVTSFRNYFCVCILFYSSFSLPLAPCFVQSKAFPSCVPTALSTHCTGSKFWFASKGEGKTSELRVFINKSRGIWEKSQTAGFSGAEEAEGGRNVGALWLRDSIQLQPV